MLLWSVPEPDNESHLDSALIAPPEEFRPASPVAFVACGGGLASFITVEGRFYLLELRGRSNTGPGLVEAVRREVIRTVACSRDHVAAISAAGEALLLVPPPGASKFEEEGGRAAMLCATSTRTLRLEIPCKVTRVSCGDSHVLFVDDNGGLYSYGDGRYGQLGLGSLVQTAPKPARVTALEPFCVVDVAAGCTHSAAATQLGNLFTWGDNQQGQLGDGTRTQKPTPALVSALEAVQAVAASTATAAIGANGKVFVWGARGRCIPGATLEGWQVRQISLSKWVLYAISGRGELLLQHLGGSSAHLLSKGPVSLVAATRGHVLALLHEAVAQNSSDMIARSRAASAETPSKSSLASPAGKRSFDTSLARNDRPHRHDSGMMLNSDVTQAKRNNDQLSEALDVQSAEHFLEKSRLNAILKDAESERSRAEDILASERAEAAHLRRAASEVGVRQMREEIRGLRVELGQTEEEQQFVDEQTSSFLPGPMKSVEDPQLLKELGDRHAELTEERTRLLRDRSLMEADIQGIQDRLHSESMQIRELEETLVQTHMAVEQQQQRVVTLRQAALRAEGELRSTQDSLMVSHLSNAHFEDMAMRAAVKRQQLEQEGVHLREEQSELTIELNELRGRLQARVGDHSQLLSEVDMMASENTTAQEALARHQSDVVRFRSCIQTLRSESEAAKCRAQELERATAEMDEFAQHEEQEMEKQRIALEHQILEGEEVKKAFANTSEGAVALRRRLQDATQLEAELSGALRARAAQFAEETEPLYAEIQTLHEQLSKREQPADIKELHEELAAARAKAAGAAQSKLNVSQKVTPTAEVRPIEPPYGLAKGDIPSSNVPSLTPTSTVRRPSRQDHSPAHSATQSVASTNVGGAGVLSPKVASPRSGTLSWTPTQDRSSRSRLSEVGAGSTPMSWTPSGAYHQKPSQDQRGHSPTQPATKSQLSYGGYSPVSATRSQASYGGSVNGGNKKTALTLPWSAADGLQAPRLDGHGGPSRAVHRKSIH